MLSVEDIKGKLKKVFNEEQATVLAETIVRAKDELVKVSDFNELKEIVRELAQAQKRTEVEIRKLVRGLTDTRAEVGGFARSVSYSLENEAYRVLPSYLKEHYGIEVVERFVRTEMEGEEINIFAKAKRDGKEVLIVGETELKLSSVGKLKRLDKKVSVVKKVFIDKEIVKLFITHYAKPEIKKKAEEKGIIIVQSFEW